MKNLNRNLKSWAQEGEKDFQIKIILFFISPFLSMLYSLKTINKKSSFLFIYLFYLFYGMCLTTSSGKNDFFTGDSASYRLRFDNWFNYYDSSNFWDGFYDFLSFNGDTKDYYFECLAFWLTRFTDNYHYFFLVVAAIYGFFMLKSLSQLVTLPEFKLVIPAFIIIYFFLDKGIYEISGVRFWTAYWVSVFAIFKIYVENEDKYYFLILITPFFHGAYWIFVVIVLLHRLLKNWQNLLIYFFSFSVFFGLVSLQLINYISGFFPSFMQTLVEAYTDPEYLEFRSTEGGYGWWIMTILSYVKFIFVNILIYLFILNKKKIPEKEKIIFTFILFWVGIFNIVINVPSLGWRFFPLAYPFIAYLWIKVFGFQKYRGFILLLPLAFSWDLVDYFRSTRTYVPAELFYQNPFTLIVNYLLS